MPKKDAYYFSHDSNARNDIKILKVRRALGLEGYAVYFCLIEILREQKDNILPMSSIEDIAYDLNTSPEKVKGVVVNFDLFKIQDETFFSARLLESMGSFNELKNRLSEAGRKGGLSRAKAWLKPGVGIKEKKIKENKIKNNDFGFEFFADNKSVRFKDGSTQDLGQRQLEMMKEGSLKPHFVKKGEIE